MSRSDEFAAYYLNRRGERGPIGPIRWTYAMGGMLVPTTLRAA